MGAGGSGTAMVAEAARCAGLAGGFAGPGVVIAQAEDPARHQEFFDAVGQHRWWQRPDAMRIPA